MKRGYFRKDQKDTWLPGKSIPGGRNSRCKDLKAHLAWHPRTPGALWDWTEEVEGGGGRRLGLRSGGGVGRLCSTINQCKDSGYDALSGGKHWRGLRRGGPFQRITGVLSE